MYVTRNITRNALFVTNLQSGKNIIYIYINAINLVVSSISLVDFPDNQPNYHFVVKVGKL